MATYSVKEFYGLMHTSPRNRSNEDGAQVRMVSERDRKLLEEGVGSILATEQKRMRSRSLKQAVQSRVGSLPPSACASPWIFFRAACLSLATLCR